EVPHPHRAAGMDAAPDITVRVERVTEPFSGMPLLRVTGYWEGKAPAEPSSWAVEVRYDGQTANRCELVPTTAADIPPGKVRFNFGTQFPVEPSAREVEVVLTTGTPRLLFKGPLAAVGSAPPATTAPGSFLKRTLHSVTSGEAFSLWRWKARLSRASEKLLALRQKVRYKLFARRFRPRTPHDASVENTALTPRLRQAITAEVAQFRFRPTFSILLP